MDAKELRMEMEFVSSCISRGGVSEEDIKKIAEGIISAKKTMYALGKVAGRERLEKEFHVLPREGTEVHDTRGVCVVGTINDELCKRSCARCIKEISKIYIVREGE